MNLNNDMRHQSQNIMDQKHLFFQRTSKVRFPKGCVFLAACSSGDVDEVRAHLKLGVNINTTNIDGLTALHQACIDANIEMVRFLVENNADINAQDNEGWTPLHAAVSVGNLDVSKYLINEGAKLNICNNDSDLPIDLCDTTNTQMKEFLDDEMQQQGIDADYERRKEELIMYEDAKKMNFDDKVQVKTGATALHVSAAKGYTRVLKILLQSGADVNAVDKDGWTPLHAAAHWEQEEACKILSESGAEFGIKTYSDQSIFDVCDTEMVAKLKQLEANSKKQTLNLVNNLKTNNSNENNNNNNNNTLTDMTSINNQFKGDNRNRKNSDEVNKTTIVRLTNEAKSTLSDKEKKQEKNLLSPITSNKSTNAFEFNNSETENVIKPMESDEQTPNVHNNKQPSFNKENRNNNITSITPNLSSNNITTNQLDQQIPRQQQQQTFTKPSTKTGLHESLKSLSAQVRMMEEDKDEMAIDQTNGFKRKSKSNEDGQKPLPIPSSSPPPPPITPTTPTATNISTSITINNLKSSNSSPKVQSGSNDQIFNSILGSPGSQSSDSRRYSTAPVASKDEQAELIRKQKAKLERHFRRSTTAVSYEDIKSAEATIKGTGSNSNLFKIEVENPATQPQQQPSTQDPTSSPTLTTLSLPQQTPLNLNIYNNKSSSPSIPAVNSGVSSLSSIFCEPIKQPNTSNNINSHNSSISLSLAHPSNQQVTQTATPIQDSSPVNTANNNNNQTSNTQQDHSENAHLIANDIETDKLLNVIEKSKGFSDSKSTQARRLRNKPIVLTSLAGLSNNTNKDDQELSASAKSKVQNLRWNEEKLELEVVRKEREEMLEKQNRLSTESNGQQISPGFSFKRQNSGPNLDTNENSLGGHPGRQTHRFGPTDTPQFTPNCNTLNSRTNIKRSVSQVPSTDRRPLTQQIITNSTATMLSTPASTNEKLKGFSSDSIDSKPFDYQTAYESLKNENESLNHTVFKLNKDLEETSKEKRAFDRRISELEEEVKKVTNLKQDNNRLKEENAALIRVISKLSK